MSFKSIVDGYGNQIANRSVLMARYGQEVGEENFDQMVLLHKIEKHHRNDDVRSIAIYLKCWIAEGFGKLPERAKNLARELNLKTDGKSVGYPHVDGTYHWFS